MERIPELGRVKLDDLILGSQELRYATKRILEEIESGKCKSISRVLNIWDEPACERMHLDYFRFAKVTFGSPNKRVIEGCPPDCVPRAVGDVLEEVEPGIVRYNSKGYLRLTKYGRELLQLFKKLS